MTGVGLLATWHSNFHDYVLHYPLSWATRPIVIGWMRLCFSHVPLTLVPTAALRVELAAIGALRAYATGVWGRGVDVGVFKPGAFRPLDALKRELGIARGALVPVSVTGMLRVGGSNQELLDAMHVPRRTARGAEEGAEAVRLV